jgi:hypothetical protein
MHDSKACVIRLDSPKINGDRVRLDGHLDIPGKPTWDVSFEFTCPNPAEAKLRARPFVLAFLPMAMRLGLPLRCEHPIDRTTHDQLRAWQSCFAAWLPLRLQIVDLKIPLAPEVKARVGGGAITAFSGGGDSCFTAMRHAGKKSASLHHTALTAGLMIHGFDIKPSALTAYNEAFESSRKILNAYHLDTYSLWTNIRERRWRPKLCWRRETHGIWLAACLSCLEPWFDVTVIPSSFSNDRALHPWASNPQTDTLLGSENALLVHDSFEFSKPAKLQQMADVKVITDHMRTCYHNYESGQNCGHCLKCSSTQVLLELFGCPKPEAFPERYTLADITKRKAYSQKLAAPVRIYILDIIQLAKEKGRSDIQQAYEKALRSFDRYAARDRILTTIRHTLYRLLGGAL